MRSGDYTGLTSPANVKEWKIDTEVQGKTVRFHCLKTSTYPENGDWLYLIAVWLPKHLRIAIMMVRLRNTLAGQTDLMWALSNLW
ncbi:MAG: hypothetical protein ACLVEJ_14535 [Parabacteroides sp.]